MNTIARALSGIALGACVGLATLATAPAAQAAIGTVDNVPAATLLLPYFAVDLADPNGVQTRFSVVNTSPAPRLAHAVLWTDTGVPSFGFDLYIGGRGSVAVDLRLLFAGILPQTDPASFPAGPDSQPHTAVATCPAGALYAGFPAPARLDAAQIAHLRAAHTGQASAAFGNQCAAAAHGDDIARGYITIDVVNTCTDAFPDDTGYFVAGGSGIAGNDNALIGQYTLIERGQRVGAASPMASIEADATNPLTSTAGNYTFYASLLGNSAADNREPLATVWYARNLDVAFFDPGTELVVWRDPGLVHEPFQCGALPADFPRSQFQLASLDEQETAYLPGDVDYYPNPPPPPVQPFPLLTQRVPVSSFSPFTSGFVLLNLNTTPAGTTLPNGLLQSYVAVIQRMNGVYGAALPGTYIVGPQYQSGGPGSCPTGGSTQPYPNCNYRQIKLH